MPSSYSQVKLPSGRKVFHLGNLEARFLAREMPGYFQHGISIGAGDIVFDVGANIGMFSVWVHDHFGPDVNIYAFEPVMPIFAVLELNLGSLGSDNVKAIPCGLSRERKTAEFIYYPNGSIFSSAAQFRPPSWVDSQGAAMKRALLLGRKDGRYPLLRWLPARLRMFLLKFMADVVLKRHNKKVSSTAERVNCDLRTVSDIVREFDIPRIDLLKVDAEGAEVDVLAGIDDRDWPNIRQVVAELEHYSEKAKQCLELLRARGFQNIELEQSKYQREFDIGLLFASRTSN